MSARIEASVEDLYNVDGKAELIKGEIVRMSPAGGLPGYAAGEVFASLREYVKRTKKGHAVSDNAAFIVELPDRSSFSPDAAYYVGDFSMKLFQGPPAFAVEVRSEGDYGASSEKKLAEKRADYFTAGTLVVWDVDLLGDDVVKVYRVTDLVSPRGYRRGEIAEAEPAVPGWTMPVDDLFAT